MNRLAAAFVLVATLVSMVIFIAVSFGAPETVVSRAPVEPLTTTTAEPDFAALVEVEAAQVESLEQEEELTETALTTATSSTTTTEPSTTTTAPPETTTTAEAPKSTSPPTTAPPTTSPPTTLGGGFSSGAESDFAGRVNSFRDSNGENSLNRNGSLDDFARASAKRMAKQGSLSHANIGSLLPPWSSVGENIGAGGSVSAVFNGLAGSSGHASNMLGDYTDFGVGVWIDADGTLWTSHVFAR